VLPFQRHGGCHLFVIGAATLENDRGATSFRSFSLFFRGSLHTLLAQFIFLLCDFFFEKQNKKEFLK
jgi:hypothetical protein